MRYLQFAIAILLSIYPLQRAHDDHQPRVVKAVSPAYDPRLVQLRAEGEVVVRTTVDSSGTVASARVFNSFLNTRIFDPLFVASAKQWRFEPSLGSATVDIRYVLVLAPLGTPVDEAGTVFVAPSTMEIRAERPRVRAYR